MKSIQLKTGETVLLREAFKEDATELINYLYKIGGESNFLTFGDGELSISVSDEETLLRDSRNAENKIMILAFVGDEIIGCLHFTGGARARTKHSGEFGVSVLRAYWDQGIGTALVEALIHWVKASEIIRKLNLRVRSDNERAVRVYEKLGFIQEGLITREFYISGLFYDSIHMGLSID